MTNFPSDDYLELQRVQRELAANRRKIAELEELINEVPAIYERKFDQKLQPLVEDVRVLSERNQALQDQLRHALIPATEAPEAEGSETGTAGEPEAATPVGDRSQLGDRPQNGAPADAAGPADALTEAPVEPSDAAEAVSAAAPSPLQRRWTWALAWPRPQRLRPVLLALVAAGGIGVVGGLGLQLLQSQGSRGGTAASQAGGTSARRPAQPEPTLVLRSSSETWLDVRDQDGTALYAGLFSGERRFPIGQGLRLNAGRPEVVRIRISDGPERGLGHPGWWVWHSFGPDGRQRVAP